MAEGGRPQPHHMAHGVDKERATTVGQGHNLGPQAGLGGRGTPWGDQPPPPPFFMYVTVPFFPLHEAPTLFHL
jgi:hypothetical protein